MAETPDLNDIANLLSRLEVNFSNVAKSFYNVFYNQTPMDVTLEIFNDDGTLVTRTIPNRAKDFTYIINGNGSPENNINADKGAIYQDKTNGELYIKTTPLDTLNGWKKVPNMDNLNALITKGNGNPEGSYVAPIGTLFIDVTNGSLYIKQTSTGATGWFEVFRTDLATTRLDNLVAEGIKKLCTSNMYLTGQLCNEDYGYTQIHKMYHSYLAPEKITATSNISFAKSGAATGFSNSDYVIFGNFTPVNDKWLIRLAFSLPDLNIDRTLLHYGSAHNRVYGHSGSGININLSSNNTSDDIGILNIIPNSDLTFNTFYEVEIIFDGSKYTAKYRKGENSSTWINSGSITSSSKIFNTGTVDWKLGGYSGEIWSGNAYLTYCAMEINESPLIDFCKTGTDELNGISIPYTMSSTGSKIVHKASEEIINNIYDRDGYALYYVINEYNKTFSLPKGEIYGFIDQKVDINDIPTKTSQLINDSGFITKICNYCISEGNTDSNGELNLVNGSTTADYIFASPGTYIINLTNASECEIEACSGGAGGVWAYGGASGFTDVQYLFAYYMQGATGAYWKGTINLSAGSHTITVGGGGAGQLNWSSHSGGNTSIDNGFVLRGGEATGQNRGSISYGGAGGSLDENHRSYISSQIAYYPGKNHNLAGKTIYLYGHYDSREINASMPDSFKTYGRGGEAGWGYYDIYGLFHTYNMNGTGGYLRIKVLGSKNVSYNVGGAYPNIKIVNKDGTVSEITGVNSDNIDTLTNGVYHKFVGVSGSELLSGNIYRGTKQPVGAPANSVWVKQADPIEVYKFDGTNWTEYDKVYIGSINVSTLGLQSYSNSYLHMNFDRLNNSVVASYKNGNNWYRVYSDGWCEQGGYIASTGTITFQKPFIDTSFTFVNGGGNYETSRTNSSVTVSGGMIWRASGYII